MSDSEDDDQSIRMPIAAYATTNSIQDPHISSTLASDVQMTDDEDENNLDSSNIDYEPGALPRAYRFSSLHQREQVPAQDFFPAANQNVPQEIIIHGGQNEESDGNISDAPIMNDESDGNILDPPIINDDNQTGFELTPPSLKTPSAPPPSPEVLQDVQDQIATTSYANTVENIENVYTLCSGESLVLNVVFKKPINGPCKTMNYKCRIKLPRAEGREGFKCQNIHCEAGEEPPRKKQKKDETSSEPKEQKDGEDGKEDAENNEN